MTKFQILILLAVMLIAGPAFSQNVSNYTAQGGAATVIGGSLEVTAAGDLLMGVSSFNICGDGTTVNANTVYYGPSVALIANTSGGQTCDINAVGSTTESGVDIPVYTGQAVQVLGMTCRNEGDAAMDVSYTLRTGAAATVPSVTCTIADNYRDCVADVQTTTDIAVGATVAVAVAAAADLGANTGFVCQVFVAY
jgi:hypothetical protein